MKQNLIYPELMREGKWRINYTNQKTHGATSNDKHEMYIPKGNSPLEKFVRMHELSHAKWSPTMTDTIRDHRWLFDFVGTARIEGGYDFAKEYADTYQVAEDGRISYLMKQKGIKGIEKGAIEFYKPQIDLTQDNPRETMLLGVIVQIFLSELYRPTLQKLRRENPCLAAILRRVRKLYIKYADDFDKSTIPVVKLITEAKKKNQQQQQKQQQGKNQDKQKNQNQNQDDKDTDNSPSDNVSGMIVCMQVSNPKERERLDQKIKESQEKVAKEDEQQLQKQAQAATQKHQQEFKDIGISSEYLRKQFEEDEKRKRETRTSWRLKDDVRWGELKIETVPLTKLISKKPAMRHRFSDSGLRIRQIHRDDIDGMVFVESHRNFRIGSLLIDCSGSMDISIQEIERIVLQCPGMIIAVYAGEAYYEPAGVLRIVAKNGKMCSRENLSLNMGNNIVDMPALQWLAKQPQKPRFWVSDGNVTGLTKEGNIGISQAIVDESFNFIKTHQILRVTNLSELEAHCLKYRM